MRKLWNEIVRLNSVNAFHTKRGFFLQDVTNPNVPLKHCAEEIVELAESNDPEEGADVVICLYASLIARGWSPDDIERIALAKLAKTYKEGVER
jgi:hypothetical protein